jgi:hypothetical protein
MMARGCSRELAFLFAKVFGLFQNVDDNRKMLVKLLGGAESNRL